MSKQEWTPAIGLRNATLSLIWRAAVVAIVWALLLWTFHWALDGIGVTRVPLLIAIGFAAVAGTIAGFVLSKGLEETAGFVSPILTLLATAFAALAIIGTEALFQRVYASSTDHLRFIIVTVTMIVAGAWILKETLIDS